MTNPLTPNIPQRSAIQRVVIDKATLKRHRACTGARTSPYWNEEDQALVYPDFAGAVRTFLETEDGTSRLRWLVRHELVPMTKEELEAAVAARGEDQ